MRIINSKYNATVISSQETSLVAIFNLILNTIAYKPFLVGGIVGTNSIITPSYSAELGFNWHLSLASKTP